MVLFYGDQKVAVRELFAIYHNIAGAELLVVLAVKDKCVRFFPLLPPSLQAIANLRADWHRLQISPTQFLKNKLKLNSSESTLFAVAVGTVYNQETTSPWITSIFSTSRAAAEWDTWTVHLSYCQPCLFKFRMEVVAARAAKMLVDFSGVAAARKLLFTLRYRYRRPVKSPPSQTRACGMRSESGRIHDAFDALKMSEFDFSSGVWGRWVISFHMYEYPDEY
ncbi:hypothetical protein B0H19DRAFT_1257340 [Mycena capillaripes]|nr:hypothetical protein B0H19DRAFT_1257340 [Mycena capillaripes]